MLVFSAEDVADIDRLYASFTKKVLELTAKNLLGSKRWKIGWRSLLVARSSLRSFLNRIHLVSSLWITSSPPVMTSETRISQT